VRSRVIPRGLVNDHKNPQPSPPQPDWPRLFYQSRLLPIRYHVAFGSLSFFFGISFIYGLSRWLA